MSTSHQDEQKLRRDTFDHDMRLRNQGSTFHQHAQADAQTPRGRFSAVETTYVVGSKPTIAYPAAGAHQADPVRPEPPLGYRVDDLEPLRPEEAQAPEPTSAPLSPRDVGSLSHGSAGQHKSFTDVADVDGRSALPPINKFRRRV